MKDRTEFTGEDNQATREQSHELSRGAGNAFQLQKENHYSCIHGFILFMILCFQRSK